jgi:Starch synthase catalytic domain
VRLQTSCMSLLCALPQCYGNAHGHVLTPLAHVTLLAHLTGGLPIALAERGHKVFTIAPRYDQVWLRRCDMYSLQHSVVDDTMQGRPARFCFVR